MSKAKPSPAEAAPEPQPEPALAPYVPSPWVVNRNYVIRTVTYHVVGRLKAVYAAELVLADAAWVADSGRWNEALRTGKLSEVEPFPGDVIVGRGAVVDACEWTHPLPREVK